MKKAIYYTVTAFVIFVIIINIFSLFNLSFFGFRIFKVASGSMSPYLNVGDVIIIKSDDNYQTEDIVTYKDKDDLYVTHRIVSINGKEIVTKGDGNNTNDTPIRVEDVVGKVVCRFKYIPKILANPISWCLLFVVGTVFVIALPERKENKEEK